VNNAGYTWDSTIQKMSDEQHRASFIGKPRTRSELANLSVNQLAHPNAKWTRKARSTPAGVNACAVMITMHVGGDIDTSPVDDEHLKRTALGDFQKVSLMCW
jgi:hypothetical protein